MENKNYYEIAEREKERQSREWNIVERIAADIGPFIGGLATFLDPKLLVPGVGLAALARIHKREDGWRINLFGRERPFGKVEGDTCSVTTSTLRNSEFGYFMNFTTVSVMKETFFSQGIEQSYIFSPIKQGYYQI